VGVREVVRGLWPLFKGNDLSTPSFRLDLRESVRPYVKAILSEEESGKVVSVGPSETPVARDLGNGLCVLYVVDRGDRFEYVQARHLQKYEIDEEALHTVAIRNLEKLALEVRLHPYGQICGVLMGGNFEASMLLLDSFWESLRQRVQTTFAVAVPARDILAFCDSGSAEGINELNALIDRVWPKGDHLISRDLYLRVDGRWVKRNELSTRK
jgi:sulfur relay (sulfurtransferase) DsrF/TusC family protein